MAATLHIVASRADIPEKPKAEYTFHNLGGLSKEAARHTVERLGIEEGYYLASSRRLYWWKSRTIKLQGEKE